VGCRHFALGQRSQAHDGTHLCRPILHFPIHPPNDFGVCRQQSGNDFLVVSSHQTGGNTRPRLYVELVCASNWHVGPASFLKFGLLHGVRIAAMHTSAISTLASTHYDSGVWRHQALPQLIFTESMGIPVTLGRLRVEELALSLCAVNCSTPSKDGRVGEHFASSVYAAGPHSSETFTGSCIATKRLEACIKSKLAFVQYLARAISEAFILTAPAWHNSSMMVWPWLLTLLLP